MTPAQQTLIKFDVKILLEQWGRWSRSTGFKQSLREGTEDNSHWFTDDHGLLIDALLCKLRISDHRRYCRTHKKPFRYKVIHRYYLDSYTIPMIARSLRIGETKALTILNNAEGKIESYMECWDGEHLNVDSRAA